MGHAHRGGPDGDGSGVEQLKALLQRRALIAPVGAALVATIVGLAVLWPRGTAPPFDGQGFFGERVDATVEAAPTSDCSYSSTPGEFLCQQIVFTVTSGTPEGETDIIQRPLDAGGPRLEAGDEVVLSYDGDAPPGAKYQFADFQRSTPIAVLALLFALAVVVLGRLRGLFALVGIGLSFVALSVFTIPALLDGRSPLAVALLSTSAVALLSLYLAHGPSQRTTVALLGTLASLALTSGLGAVFVAASRLTGLGSDEASFLQVFGGQLNFQGLLLAGLVIGALGVLDDVTVTQASAVWELHAADPAQGRVRLYRAGLRIGRDHIASTVNTLVLAYAGASLPLLLLFRTADQGLASVLTGEAVASEIVRALVGSIGLVASVPITTWLAAVVVSRSSPTRTSAGAGDSGARSIFTRRGRSRRGAR